jgi:hypothetical protein
MFKNLSRKQKYIGVFTVVILAMLIIVSFAYYMVSNNKPSFTDFPIERQLNDKLKINYSSKWNVTDNAGSGLLLENSDSTKILITSVKDSSSRTLDQIVDERISQLKSILKIKSDTKTTINFLIFRRVEFSSQDDESFPSDGVITYATVIDNIYTVATINFKPGTSIQEAENIIKTIRQN